MGLEQELGSMFWSLAVRSVSGLVWLCLPKPPAMDLDMYMRLRCPGPSEIKRKVIFILIYLYLLYLL